MSTADEIRRLGSLVRRVRGPTAPPHPGEEVTLGDLNWNLTFLRYGLHAVLPKDHPILEKARDADQPNHDTLPIWCEVAEMPWHIVEAAILAVQKEHAISNFEHPE